MRKEYQYYLIAALSLLIMIIVFKYILDDNFTYEIYLNGDSEETFLVNEYVDNGALALRNRQDISYDIIRESNIEENKPGDYEIYYSIYGKNRNDEYKVKRIVHIIDLNIKRSVDKTNHCIYLSLSSSEYMYTVLPDKTINYNNDIEYHYSDDGEYHFEVFLKNNVSKKFVFKIYNYDNLSPEASCVINIDNNNVKYSLNAFDDSGIKKYVLNNKDYYSDEIVIPFDEYQSNIVRIYDTQGNYMDAKCTTSIDTSFKEIKSSSEKHGYISCNSDVTSANNELNKIIEIYGNKTRSSVVAAAVYLTNYSYNISYTWGGKSLKYGLSSNWGCPVSVSKDQCTHSLGANTCEAGLDCTGFTSWAFYQAGFDKSIIRTSSQSTGMWGNFNALVHRYSFVSNQDKVNLIKVGDIVHTEGHVGMVIGISDETLQVANMVGPIKISIINKQNGNSINNQHSFDNFVLFDEFFEIYGNKNS